MNDILSQGLHLVATHWQAWFVWLGSGGAVWFITQAAKNWRNWNKSSTIQRFVLVVSFLGTASDWFLTNYSTSFAHAQNPFIWFPTATACLFTIATFLHHTPLKQFTVFLSNTVTPYFQAVGEVKRLKAAQTPPTVPDSFQ